MTGTNESTTERIPSGIGGLDDVLCGGMVTGRLYLVCGRPGTGKTLLGMHFLEEGLERDETVLFIHGEESRDEILTNGAELGIDVSDAEFLDLGPESAFFTEDRSYDLVEPSDVERDRYTREIHDTIREIDPERVVIDPITQLRYIEPNEHQFRKRILSLMRFLKERDTAVVTTATTSTTDGTYDTEIQSLSDSVVELERGDAGRRLRVTKHRGYGQQSGSHGMAIRVGGIEVFPAVVPERYEGSFDPDRLGSGNDDLDTLLGGGIERGTVTFVTGPTGAGKTTTAAEFLTQAAADGEAVAYLFEESVETFTHRSESIGMPIERLRESDDLTVEAVEPLSLSAEEFAHRVEQRVERDGADVVLIDGIDGYTTALQGDEETLVRKLQVLTRYLKNRDVTVLVTDEIPQVTGISGATGSNLSYLADNVVVVSYVEMDGRLEKVIGVLKKRAGGFERTLREFEITTDGIEIGEPLTEYTGILDGTPHGRRSHE